MSVVFGTWKFGPYQAFVPRCSDVFESKNLTVRWIDSSLNVTGPGAFRYEI